MGKRLVMALLLATLAVLLPGGLAAGGGETVAAGAAVADASGRAHSEPADRRGKGKKRPGCRKFCQQAGGFGDGGETPAQPVVFPEQVIGGTRDRIVAVKATCQLDTECVGAIILNGRHVYEYGRADLRIPAQSTRKVKVGLSRKGLEALKERGDDRRVAATAPLTDETQPVSFSKRITLLAP